MIQKLTNQVSSEKKQNKKNQSNTISLLSLKLTAKFRKGKREKPKIAKANPTIFFHVSHIFLCAERLRIYQSFSLSCLISFFFFLSLNLSFLPLPPLFFFPLTFFSSPSPSPFPSFFPPLSLSVSLFSFLFFSISSLYQT